MNHEKNRHNKSAVSLDGIKPRRTTKASSESLGFRPSTFKSEKNSNLIDNFDKPEGLSQNNSKTIDVPKPKRKKFNRFNLFRKNKNKFDGIDHYDARKAKRKKRLKIAGIIVCVLLLVFGFLIAKGYINLRKILSGGGGAAALEENVDPSKLRVEGDGRINILLLGRGGIGHDGPDLTDTIIVISIDPVAKEAGLVSIPRDLYVTVPDKGSMKINSVFYTGKSSVLNNAGNINDFIKTQADNEGLSLMDKTVENVLGIPIHYHAMIDFKGFKKTIDTIGGIDINATESVREQMLIDGQPYLLNVKKGYRHMDGFEALAYSRSRHTSARGDFSRSERQRTVISAVKDKILSLGTYSNPATLSRLLDDFGNNVQTNFSLDDLNKLYGITKQIDSSKIVSIGLADPPNDFLVISNLNGLSVVIPKDGAENYEKIHYYIRTTLRDSFLKQENANVLVINASSRSDLGKKKKYELESFGYTVIGTENMPNLNYSKTVLVDLRDGEKKYTKHYLQKRFNTLAIDSLPNSAIQPGLADFVIIIGNDISAKKQNPKSLTYRR